MSVGKDNLGRLVKSLLWAMQEIADSGTVDKHGIPSHTCEYTTDPDRGSCAFHEHWVEACEALEPHLGHLPFLGEEE